VITTVIGTFIEYVTTSIIKLTRQEVQDNGLTKLKTNTHHQQLVATNSQHEAKCLIHTFIHLSKSKG
jgi:hypothetical protein